mmetsp:Transcript_9092/g.21113  ORF Transcript_9092/g.21113 Transcript_9092/m.21113 type:complete len:269 (+) Transcript_9092:1098-1904(+)
MNLHACWSELRKGPMQTCCVPIDNAAIVSCVVSNPSDWIISPIRLANSIPPACNVVVENDQRDHQHGDLYQDAEVLRLDLVEKFCQCLVKLLQASQAQEPQDSDKARSLAKAKHACCVNVCAQDNDDDVCSHRKTIKGKPRPNVPAHHLSDPHLDNTLFVVTSDARGTHIQDPEGGSNPVHNQRVDGDFWLEGFERYQEQVVKHDQSADHIPKHTFVAAGSHHQPLPPALLLQSHISSLGLPQLCLQRICSTDGGVSMHGVLTHANMY